MPMKFQRYTKLMKLLEIYDQLSEENKKDVLNHARQLAQKTNSPKKTSPKK